MKFSIDNEMDGVDYIICGAGLCGSVLARLLADSGKKVIVLEKRDVIGGNLYDYKDENGLLIQKYGPHVFHTNNREVYNFITKFCKPVSFITKCSVNIHGIETPSPFNFKTIDQFFGTGLGSKIKNHLLKAYPNQKYVTIVDLLASTDSLIKEYAQFLFDSDYALYTAKQWGISPSQIDPSVLKRVPVLLNYDEQYFYDEFQFMPEGGFTAFVASLLSSSNISVYTSSDFFDFFKLKDHQFFLNHKHIDSKVIFTGMIDKLFKYSHGDLLYRSLRFDFKSINTLSFQSAPIVSYPEAKGYTRITEYSKMPVQQASSTVIAYEFPIKYTRNAEPFYPILTAESQDRYQKYFFEAKKIKSLFLCGRLADYKYYNMDQAIIRAFDVFTIL